MSSRSSSSHQSTPTHQVRRNWTDRGVAILNEFTDVNFFFSNLLVPLALFVLYAALFSYVSGRTLPDGVNYYFTARSWKYASIVLAVMCLPFMGLLIFNKDRKFAPRISKQNLSLSDLLLIFLPLTPVLQYILNNQDILSPLESLSVFGFFALFSGIILFVLPALLGLFSSARASMILGLAFVYTLLNMASLSHYFSWPKRGSLKIEWAFMAGVFLITWLFYYFKNQKTLYLLIVLSFVANSAVQLLSSMDKVEENSLPAADNKLLSMVERQNQPPETTPNIYLLLYDAYVSNETMLAHGIDNSFQEDFLRSMGFELYPHTYSVDGQTNATMSRVLNAATAYYGDLRKAVSGNGIVQHIMKYFGYRTLGVFYSDYFFLSMGSSYDFSIPERSSASIHLVNAILLGEFRFDLGFKQQPREQFLESKQSIFKSAPDVPVFVYMHSNYPGHSQNSGVCRPNETELYQERLAIANTEMQQDLNTLINHDPQAIIIVAGDHGPYLTKNCTNTRTEYDISEISRLDIQDRFGTFLAVRWPTQDYKKYDEITVLQDLFPVIFAYLYDDARFLKSKIDPVTFNPNRVSGASVQNGIIQGGIHDGEPLFLSGH